MIIRDDLEEMVAQWLHRRSRHRDLPWESLTEPYRDGMRDRARALLQAVAAEHAPAQAAQLAAAG